MLPDQVLPQQAGVDEHAQGHPGVRLGLKLQEEHHVDVAAISPRDAPDEVTFAPLARVGVEFRIQAFQAVQVEAVQPGTGNEVA